MFIPASLLLNKFGQSTSKLAARNAPRLALACEERGLSILSSVAGL